MNIETKKPVADNDAEENRPRTAPKEVRKNQLIEATIDCIAENGISGTTMAKVTKRAGLSVGIVSLHFESKENLLTSTLVYLSDEVRATWAEVAEDESLGSAEKLFRISLASFDPRIFTPEKIAVWFAFFGEAQYRASYRKMVESYDDERGEVIKALSTELLATSQNPDRDPQVILDSIECFSDGLWLNAIVYPDDFTREYCIAQVEQFFAALFPNRFGRGSKSSQNRRV